MKTFKTFDEQLEILKSRGLLFSDEESAKEKLMFYGYYEIINGYKDFLLKEKISANDEDIFMDNSTFDHIYSLFRMDKTLTSSVIDATCDVEMFLRTVMSYVISKNISEEHKEYLKRLHYRPGKKNNNGRGYKIDQLLKKFNKIIQDDVEPMKHYRECHHNVPPWIMFKGTTFGNLVHFYQLQKPKNKKEIVAMMLGLPMEMVTEDVVEMFTDMIFLCHSYRNRAAHGGRMYNYRSLKSIIRFNKKFHGRANVTEADYRKGKGKSCLGTLFNTMTWFDNHTALIQLKAGISVALDHHLKIYPEDYELIFSETNLSVDILNNN